MDDVPTRTFPRSRRRDDLDERRVHAGQRRRPLRDLEANQCYRAYEYIKNRWGTFGYASGNIVVRITDGCTFKSPVATVQNNTLRGNLAILSDGGYEFRNQINWLAGVPPLATCS